MDMINHIIPEIILQQTYGELTDLRHVGLFKNTVYDRSTSVDKVFTKVKNFQRLCIIPLNEKTYRQYTFITYYILKNINSLQIH